MASTEDTSSAVDPVVPADPQPPIKASIPPKRPLTGTKSTPPKTSSFMNPTSTTTARSTVGSTLNKPPARPTSSTAIKKPSSSTPTMASAHKSRPSLVSNDEGVKSGASGDEKKTSGISKLAKRMSLAGGTFGRSSATKAASATPDRRSTIHSSPPSEKKPVARPSTLSPTRTRAPTTPASKTPESTMQRSTTKPLTSSRRSAGVSEGKKRLTTIPDSPAVKIERSEEDKETEQGFAVPAAPSANDANEESTRLKAELEESQAKVEALRKELGEMQLKMTEFGLAAEAEASNVQAAKEAIQAEHSSQRETLLALHATEVAELQKKIEDMETRERAHAEQAAKDTEKAKADAEKMDSLVASHSKEVTGLLQKVEEAEAREQSQAEQALKDLEDARVTYQRQIDNGNRELAGQNNVIKSLQGELETAHQSKEQEI